MFLSSKLHPSGGDSASPSLFRRLFEGPRQALARNSRPADRASRALVGGAVDVLDRALDADPDSARAHAQMGALCERRGQVHAAYRWYKQALSLDPGCSLALDGIRRYCLLMGLDEDNPRLNPAAAGREVDSRTPGDAS